MNGILDFFGRNLDIGGYVAGAGVVGFLLKALVEKFVSQSKVDSWFDNLRESFVALLNKLTAGIVAFFENIGIWLTKWMSGRIGKAIWNNTFEVLLIWFIEGILGMVVVFITWLATLPGQIMQAFFKGLRSDNINYTPLNGKKPLSSGKKP